MIQVTYNCNPNLPQNIEHLTKKDCTSVKTRRFDDVDSAVQFWLECSFYGNEITKLGEILKDCPEEVRKILSEKPIDTEEVLLDDPNKVYDIIDEPLND